MSEYKLQPLKCPNCHSDKVSHMVEPLVIFQLPSNGDIVVNTTQIEKSIAHEWGEGRVTSVCDECGKVVTS